MEKGQPQTDTEEAMSPLEEDEELVFVEVVPSDSPDTNKTVKKKAKEFTNPFKMTLSSGDISVVQESVTNPNKGKFIGKIDGKITPLKCFMLLFDRIKVHLLSATNARRQARVEQRETKEGKIGRPSEYENSSDPKKKEKYDQNRQYYLDRHKDDFKMQDLTAFLSCFFMMGVAKLSSVEDYWKDLSLFSIGLGCYFNNRTKKYVFDEIFRSLDADVDLLEQQLNEVFKEVWEMGYDIASDESVARGAMHNNPHHMFQPCKPEKNGSKVYSAADVSTFIGYFKLHKRSATEPKDPPLHRTRNEPLVRTPVDKYTTLDAIVDGIDHIKGVYCFAVDRLYGSVELVEAAMERGVNLVACCKSNRKSDIFVNFLHKQTPNEHNVIAGSGETKNGLSFSAFTAVSDKGKKLNFLSTDNISKKYTLLKKTNLLDEDKDGQSLAGKVLPVEVVKYFKIMGHVDQANKSIAAVQYPHRIYRWRISYLFWMLSVMVHNAFVIFNSLVPKAKQLSKKEFMMELSQTIYTPPISGEHVSVRSEVRRDCKICRSLMNKSSSTTRVCTCCGHMHNKCFLTLHDKYLLQCYLEPEKKRKRPEGDEEGVCH